MSPPVFRESCGAHLGIRLHQAGGEELCSRCRRGEVLRHLELERLPTRPSDRPAPPGDGPAEVAERVRLLVAAVDGDPL